MLLYALRRLPRLPPTWQANLMALPGVLTLLSVLAVIVGAHSPAHDTPPRPSTNTVSPNLPELRPLPMPAPNAPVLVAPPPAPLAAALPRLQSRSAAPLVLPQQLVSFGGLRWWGRRQTDGG